MYCCFYRPRWWWLSTISSLASSIPEGQFTNPNINFGKLSPAFLRTKVELMTSASLRNLSNISKATCDNTEFNYPQCAWERTQDILSDRMRCTHSSGEGGTKRIDGDIWGFCTNLVSSQTKEAADPWLWLAEVPALAECLLGLYL